MASDNIKRSIQSIDAQIKSHQNSIEHERSQKIIHSKMGTEGGRNTAANCQKSIDYHKREIESLKKQKASLQSQKSSSNKSSSKKSKKNAEGKKKRGCLGSIFHILWKLIKLGN